MAGYNYWFPKAFGFKLDERWGRASFWCWLIGFYIAFMPLYALGLMGMTRRMQHYDVVSWQPWLVVAAFGVVVILVGIVSQVIQLVVSIRDREQLQGDRGPMERPHAGMGDGFAAAGLEFRRPAARSTDLDAFWNKKQRERTRQAQPTQERKFEPIEMPKNSATGFVTAFFAVVTGFALIWHIWWMAGVGAIGAILTMLAFAFRDEEEIEMPAEQIAAVRTGPPGRRLQHECRCCS